jgi:hypothetical protein
MNEFHSLGLYLCSSLPMFFSLPKIFSTSSLWAFSFSYYSSFSSTPTIIFSRML